MTEETNVDVKEQPLPLWRRVLMALIILCLVFMVGAMAASYLLRLQLGREISKIADADEPLRFSELAKTSTEVVTTEDASQYYTEAILAISPDDKGNLLGVNRYYLSNLDSIPAGEIPKETHQEIAQQMIKLNSVLMRLDKAASIPLSSFDMDLNSGSEACQKRLAQVRSSSLLLSLRVLEAISRDKDEAAAHFAISMLKMFRVFDSYPTMIVSRSRAGLVGLACDDIRLLLEHSDLSEEVLRSLQSALNETIKSTDLERSFQAERIYQMAIARNFLPQKIADRYLRDDFLDMPEKISIPNSSLGKLKLQAKSILFFRQIAELITEAGKPWPAILDALEKSSKKPSQIVKISIGFVNTTADISTFSGATVTSIAIERYRKANGKVPGSLDELVPNFIDAIPVDPYTGGPLHYVHDEKGYTVYGNGSNRIDDGGKIISPVADKMPLDRGFKIRFRK